MASIGETGWQKFVKLGGKKHKTKVIGLYSAKTPRFFLKKLTSKVNFSYLREIIVEIMVKI